MPKPARLEHVKFVYARGRWYAYFNTGKKEDGKPIYSRMPAPGAVGFFDSYAAHMAARTKRAAVVCTVAQLADEYLESLEYLGKAEGTRRLYKIQLAKVARTLGEFPSDDLHPSDVRDAIDLEQFNPATRNAFVSAIGAMYTWARRRRKTTLEPTKDIERIRGGEHDPWPEHVLADGLAADDAGISLAVHLLYYTGQRISDVCDMRWNDIRDGAIHGCQRKTGKPYTVPLHEDLRAQLDRSPRKGITILTGDNGMKLRTARLRMQLQAFTRARGAETVPHGLRKNAVNALLEAGCTIAEVASITGQTFAMVEHYAARVDTRKLGKAAMLKFEAGTKAVKESTRKTNSENSAKST
jgi:integrase